MVFGLFKLFENAQLEGLVESSVEGVFLDGCHEFRFRPD